MSTYSENFIHLSTDILHATGTTLCTNASRMREALLQSKEEVELGVRVISPHG